MRTTAKGNAAEAAVLSAFVQRDLPVLVPFGEGQPFDLVVQVGASVFLRVQCKTARLREGCLVFNGRTTDHGRGRLSYLGLADVFGVYVSPSYPVYLVPVHDVSSVEVRLRLEPARNNQQAHVRFAHDFEMVRWPREALLELATSPPSLGEPSLITANGLRALG
jgi:hypothetical protein